MKAFPLRVAVAFGLLWACLAGSAQGQSTDNDGCSNATLTGDYGFTISGQIFIPNGPVIQREGIAMTHFDGAAISRSWTWFCQARMHWRRRDLLFQPIPSPDSTPRRKARTQSTRTAREPLPLTFPQRLRA